MNVQLDTQKKVGLILDNIIFRIGKHLKLNYTNYLFTKLNRNKFLGKQTTFNQTRNIFQIGGVQVLHNHSDERGRSV